MMCFTKNISSMTWIWLFDYGPQNIFLYYMKFLWKFIVQKRGYRSIEVSPILLAKVSKYRALHKADTFGTSSQQQKGWYIGVGRYFWTTTFWLKMTCVCILYTYTTIYVPYLLTGGRKKNCNILSQNFHCHMVAVNWLILDNLTAVFMCALQ